MGGRKVSRPYRVWFFAEGERFLSFWRCQCFAKRLFFMFLFLIPFTIRQHCIIYPQEFSTEPKKFNRFNKKIRANLWFRQMNTNYTMFFVESVESV